jgi:hypothetical protein
LSFSLAFNLLVVLHGTWIQISNFVLFIVDLFIKVEIEKPSDQYLGLICDEQLTCLGLNLNPGSFCGSTFVIYLGWRIVFACLVVCRCQVWHGGQRQGLWLE